MVEKKDKAKENKEEQVVKEKHESKKQEKTLKLVVIISLAILVLILIVYFYIQVQNSFNYNGIQFKAVNEGSKGAPLIMYFTKTLLLSNDGANESFGFRVRTNPRQLAKIPFEDLENFKLLTVNGYSFDKNFTFYCEGDKIIAIPNFERVFTKMGMKLVMDPNATCDASGRYNYFYFTYGNETEIKKIGENCYEVFIKGNDEKCEVLPATEKIMVEMFVKYKVFISE